MPLSVKVSFQTKSQKHSRGATTYHDEESRRFAIEEDVASNYEYFRAKIINVMPSLKNKAFRLYWKDDEDDLVTFSSDDELIEALGHVPDNSDCTFRVYIREVDDVISTPPIGDCYNRRVPGGIRLAPPLHLLFGAQQGACGGRPRGTTCDNNGNSNAATSSSSSTRTSAEHGEPAGTGDEKMDEVEAGCSKSDGQQHVTDDFLANINMFSGIGSLLTSLEHGKPAGTGDEKMDEVEAGCSKSDGQQHVTNDFLANINMFSGIGSLLTSLGVQNNQSQSPGEKSRDEQWASEQANESNGVTGAGGSNGSDSNENHEKSSESNQSPHAGASNDGLIQVVETLKEMGFKDEDGSLSRLVATHSGQIERIIQFIETCRATC